MMAKVRLLAKTKRSRKRNQSTSRANRIPPERKAASSRRRARAVRDERGSPSTTEGDAASSVGPE
jgi:hypothetical protein